MEREFFASCLGGLEQALACELRAIGIGRVRPLGGGVAFFCTPELAYRACLWSRVASRIMLIVGRIDAESADQLYAGAYEVPWEDVLAAGATFAVRAHGANDQLRNERFTSLKTKDAIADRLRERGALRPQVDVSAPRATIDVRIRANRATLSLDFSGEALNHRSYLAPDEGEDAPLSCSLAAGALALASWGGEVPADAFVDPACRDGIMLVEAASVACDLAAGLNRAKWGFTGWAHHDEAMWSGLLDEARGRFEARLADIAGKDAVHAPREARPDLTRVRFVAASTSSPAIAKAREHVKRAGLRQVASVELADDATIGQLVGRVIKVAHRARAQGEPGFLVASNLDSGARFGSIAQLQADERTFADACAHGPAHARFVAVGAESLAARFPAEGSARWDIGSGRVHSVVEVFSEQPVELPVIEIPSLSGGASRSVRVFEQSSAQFAARLRKVFKERRKWAAREGVSCYRVYDADLPGYAVAIDWYVSAGPVDVPGRRPFARGPQAKRPVPGAGMGDRQNRAPIADARGGCYLHIAEYAPPSSIDADKAARRLNDVLAIAPLVCGVRPDHVFSKRRVRERGGAQYRAAGRRSYRVMVEEGGYRFEADLAGHLDTGLFLDHRITRELVRAKARQARFLNLFAYTGTASVYAAGGGAATTTTVDLSQTYLDWARRNMAANGFSGDAHEFVRADVVRWITEARRARRTFDLVFVDPPTFSNSKAMGKKTWDVQRDHVELLIGVTRLLAEGGLAVFSCNLRSFKPAVDELARYGVSIEDISTDTIPLDFARTPKIHRCYLVRRTTS